MHVPAIRAAKIEGIGRTAFLAGNGRKQIGQFGYSQPIAKRKL